LGWETDIYSLSPKYRTPIESHELVSEEKPLGKTSCLLLNNLLARCSNCQTDFILIEENHAYLQAGWIKSINGDARLGRRWFDSKKTPMTYDFVPLDSARNQWNHYSQIILSPFKARYCRLWMNNHENQGGVLFDDILFIELDLPNLREIIQ